MKKVLWLFLLLILHVSCNNSPINGMVNVSYSLMKEKQHVFHTYYGDLDTLNTEPAYVRNGVKWYQVRYSEKDSFNWDGVWKYNYGLIIDYYCPDTDTYEESVPDNHGNAITKEFDPYHQYDWLNN